jgi:hypothetical protein
MKNTLAALLLLFSTSVLADRFENGNKPPEKDCDNPSEAVCGYSPPGLSRPDQVPVPGTLALVGLGIAGLVVLQKRGG